MSENISASSNPSKSQTFHYTTSTTEKRQRQGQTEEETGSSFYDQCSDFQASYIGETGRNLTEDWRNESEQREKVMPTITSLNINDLRTTLLTGIFGSVSPTVLIIFNEWLCKAGLPT